MIFSSGLTHRNSHNEWKSGQSNILSSRLLFFGFGAHFQFLFPPLTKASMSQLHSPTFHIHPSAIFLFPTSASVFPFSPSLLPSFIDATSLWHPARRHSPQHRYIAPGQTLRSFPVAALRRPPVPSFLLTPNASRARKPGRRSVSGEKLIFRSPGAHLTCDVSTSRWAINPSLHYQLIRVYLIDWHCSLLFVFVIACTNGSLPLP